MRYYILISIIFFSIFAAKAQSDSIYTNWEKVYQYFSPNITFSKFGATLYAIDGTDYYHSVDTGKTWVLKIKDGDAPFSQYEDLILTSGNKYYQTDNGVHPSIYDSWVDYAKRDFQFHRLGFINSTCGWHSGICKNWTGNKICDSIAMYGYFESGYLLSDGYYDIYYVDADGNVITRDNYNNQQSSFSRKHRCIGFKSGDPIFLDGNKLSSLRDSTAHSLPEENIPNLKVAVGGNRYFVFKQNNTVWVTDTFKEWKIQNILLDSISEFVHTHNLFIAKTKKGFYKATLNDSLVWTPLFLSQIPINSINNLTVFNKLMLIQNNGKLYRSFNNGVSWDTVVTTALRGIASSIGVKNLNDTANITFNQIAIDILKNGDIVPSNHSYSGISTPDTARLRQYVAINNNQGLMFSSDGGQTFIQTNTLKFKAVFFKNNYLYGISAGAIWRIDPQKLVCFSSEKSTVITLGCYETFNLNGQILSKPGIYHTTTLNTYGCQDVVSVELKPNTESIYGSIVGATFCVKSNYYFGKILITKSGKYQYTDTLNSGCQITNYLNATVLDSILNYNEITKHQGDIVQGVRLGATDTIFITRGKSFDGCDVVNKVYVHVIPFSTPLNSITESEIIVSPNPFENYLDVTLKSNKPDLVDISIYNTQAQLIFKTTSIENKARIDTQNWLSGVYFLKIKVGSSYIVHKVVKSGN